MTPYEGEVASKTGHGDIIRNPLVQAFLADCKYLRVPSEEEAALICKGYTDAPSGTGLPEIVIATDASQSDNAIDRRLPSTRLGFIKVSQMIIRLSDEDGLRSQRYVDPFKVAEIERKADHIALVLPGSNVVYKGEPTIRRSYRRAIHEQLALKPTSDPLALSLEETLIRLQHQAQLTLELCPECKADVDSAVMTITQPTTRCPHCGETLYASDKLRLHEGLSEEGEIAGTVTRAMNAIEQLILAQNLYQVLDQQPEMLSRLTFMVDGPLSVNGQPAKLHTRMLQLVADIRAKLAQLGLPGLLLIGLQKTGALAEHARLMQPHLPANSIRLVDDEYRNRHVREVVSEDFGYDTHYGQDFIFKAPRGEMFVFALPYPVSKKPTKAEMKRLKADISNYPELGRACDLIRHFQTDLYESALIPIALAHRHASISLQPGGKVLTQLARQTLEGKGAAKVR